MKETCTQILVPMKRNCGAPLPVCCFHKYMAAFLPQCLIAMIQQNLQQFLPRKGWQPIHLLKSDFHLLNCHKCIIGNGLSLHSLNLKTKRNHLLKALMKNRQ